MTVYNDLILSTNPAMFVPWDAPADTGFPLFGTNLGTAGGGMAQTIGGVKQAAPGQVEFTAEIALDGVDDYWTANSTMFNGLISATSGATLGSTWACWWRCQDRSVGPRYALRMDPWGMGIRRSVGTMTAEYYDTSNTLHQVSVSNTQAVEMGGGWQLTAFTIDPTEGAMIIYRNGFPQITGGGTINSSTARIRTTSTTSVVIGRNPSSGASSSWVGSIGPIFMWPRVLSPEEILDTYYWALNAQAQQTVTVLRPYTGRMRPEVLMRGTP